MMLVSWSGVGEGLEIGGVSCQVVHGLFICRDWTGLTGSYLSGGLSDSGWGYL